DQPRKRPLRLLQLNIDLESILPRLLARSNVGPGSNQFQGLFCLVVHDFERILDPNIVPVPMSEPVFNCPAALPDEWSQFTQDARGIIRVQAVGPALRIRYHFIRGKAHDRPNIFTDECASKIPSRVGGVDNCGTDGEQVFVSLTRASRCRINYFAFAVQRLKLTNALTKHGNFCRELLVRLLAVFHRRHRTDDAFRTRMPRLDQKSSMY